MNPTIQHKQSVVCSRVRLTTSNTIRNIFISVGLLFALTGPLAADKPQPTIITFDAPGAVATFVAGINPAGVISGGYVDANNVLHGYVRAPDGTFTTYEAPGAGTGPGQGTGPNGINNPAGDITGNVTDASNVTHGYIRAKDGTIAKFDAPGATVAFGTVGFGINPAGVIAGIWGDSNMVHGFVRAKDGTITTFDPPSSIGTFMADGGCINPAGLIVGQYFDATFVQHGFVRAPDGAVSQDRCSGCGPIRHRRPGRQPGRND